MGWAQASKCWEALGTRGLWKGGGFFRGTNGIARDRGLQCPWAVYDIRMGGNSWRKWKLDRFLSLEWINVPLDVHNNVGIRRTMVRWE